MTPAQESWEYYQDRIGRRLERYIKWQHLEGTSRLPSDEFYRIMQGMLQRDPLEDEDINIGENLLIDEYLQYLCKPEISVENRETMHMLIFQDEEIKAGFIKLAMLPRYTSEAHKENRK